MQACRLSSFHHVLGLSKIALPKHPLQILQLLGLKGLKTTSVSISMFAYACLGYRLAASHATRARSKTHLNINKPSILPRLLKITQSTLHTLPHHPRITRRFPGQRGQNLRQPSRRRRHVWKSLDERAKAQDSRVAREDEFVLLLGRR